MQQMLWARARAWDGLDLADQLPVDAREERMPPDRVHGEATIQRRGQPARGAWSVCTFTCAREARENEGGAGIPFDEVLGLTVGMTVLGLTDDRHRRKGGGAATGG